jgi:lipoate---protein ligase
MKYIDLTLPTPAENLAYDEALLDLCEADQAGEILRFWEGREPFVVVGYANQVQREVNLAACQAQSVPIFRRSTGGGTVLQGPGCLNYSLFLKIPETGPLHTITGTNTYIMEQNRAAIATLLQTSANVRGHSDLTVDDLKFSGNAQRRRRKFLIFHGTFLLKFDIAAVERFLRPPSKQPEYRRERTHADFLTNLPLQADEVKSALRKIWHADEPAVDLPLVNLPELVVKYSSDSWNLKF